MTGLPVFFCTGALDRSIDFLMRSSWIFFWMAIFSSRIALRRSFSLSFSALSTSSCGMFSIAARCSSSLVSMFWSIGSAVSEPSASNPHFSYTSATLLLRFKISAPMSWSSAWPLSGLARSRRAAALASSALMLSTSASIWELRSTFSFSILVCVTSSFCFSSSSCSSVSCEFWIRKRLRSSSPAKMSRSCCGRVKYIGTSNGFPSSGSHASISKSSCCLAASRCFTAAAYSASRCAITLGSVRFPFGWFFRFSISAWKFSSSRRSSCSRACATFALRCSRLAAFSCSWISICSLT
mmetsp:Transcript_12231/g.29205  ORF Transcript_12231/g.29205 Transcript_12231/m.29205 type:complete len:296 (+) Transcript_12231:236-1123(+)